MLYSLLYTVAMLLAAPLLLRRRTRRKYLHSLAERLGLKRGAIDPRGRPAIWVHGVSVGEALAARSLVRELRRRFPGHAVLVSTTTATGRQIAEEKLEADGFLCFPFDWKFAVRRALGRTRARLCVLMETELWPNFIRVLGSRGVPLVLANGRISDRSFGRYRPLRGFFGPLLRRFSALCAQSGLDADRLESIGARPTDIIVSGNLKYQLEQFEPDPSLVERLRRLLRLEPEGLLLVAGSTHAGEEEALLSAFSAAKRHYPKLRLAIAPRRPERFEAVGETLSRGGWDWVRLSSLGDEGVSAGVVLVDAIGLLQGLYCLASVAFVGGSLSAHGGHNPLEACAAGVPVLFGPHMTNFRSVAEQVLSRGAGRRVESVEELTCALMRLLGDDSLRREMGRGGRAVLEANQGALEITADAVEAALALGAGKPMPAAIRLAARVHAASAGIFRSEPRRALARARRLPRPVVSVGGLSFGGSAKTSLVQRLAERYAAAGLKVAILTRGYGGRGADPLVVSDGRTILADALEGGDEPVMLARAVSGAIVVKDRDRRRGGLLAMERFSPDLFILDDGFQHRALRRDCNLLLLQADSLFGARAPAQLPREPLRFAAAADAVIMLDADDERTGAVAKRRLEGIGCRSPVFFAAYKACDCYDLRTGENIPTDQLASREMPAFCGIAVPRRFARTLAAVGLRPQVFLPYPDHHQYSPQDMLELRRALKEAGANVMITTEKDAQRLARGGISSLPVLVLRVRLEIDREEEFFELVGRLIER